jgi:hypothetical protein
MQRREFITFFGGGGLTAHRKHAAETSRACSWGYEENDPERHEYEFQPAARTWNAAAFRSPLTNGTKSEHTRSSLRTCCRRTRWRPPTFIQPRDFTAPRKRMAMKARKYPVFVEGSYGRMQAGFTASANATPVDVSLLLREKGWRAYRVRPDHSASAWVAAIIDWKSAA